MIGKLYVVKRDGRKESVKYDKISDRITDLCENIEPVISLDDVDVAMITQKVVTGVYPGVSTDELDILAAETAAYLSTVHPSYADIAARIAISNLHKKTSNSFLEVMKIEYEHINPKTLDPSPLVSKELYDVVTAHAEEIEREIDYTRDYNYKYFGFKTLEKSYLQRIQVSLENGKIESKIVERPQHMIMRVCLGIHFNDLKAAFESYRYMSKLYFTHATPTLFNSGTPTPQMSSCFLLRY